jgi:hypothetical protein
MGLNNNTFRQLLDPRPSAQISVVGHPKYNLLGNMLPLGLLWWSNGNNKHKAIIKVSNAGNAGDPKKSKTEIKAKMDDLMAALKLVTSASLAPSHRRCAQCSFQQVT